MGAQGENVGDLLLRGGQDGDVAVIDRDGEHTYAELRRATARVSAQLREWSLAPGSRVGLISGNGLFWAASYLGILRAGLVAVPFATTSTPQDVANRSAFVGCSAFLLDAPSRRRVGDGVPPGVPVGGPEVMGSADEAVSSGAGPDEVAAVDPDDDAVLMFTSGTTSAPRAVRVSHRNIAANTASIVDYLGLTAQDRVLVVLPFSYCYGASLLHTHLAVGGSVSICDSFAFPETALEAIRRDGCTGLAGVPSTYQILLRASTFAEAELPTLRRMQQAGGRLAPAQVQAVAAAQPQAELFVMYGATEATARMAYLPPSEVATRPGSIGRAIPGVELRLLDEHGQEVPPGSVGEIVARGENIAQGYWNDPEGTAAKFVDGGLRTGDLARADEDGFLHVVDRLDDFIKSWGVRVSSKEVEDAILSAPGVTSAAVVGRPAEDAGEAIVAFYVPAEGSGVTPEEVLAHCRTRLARPLVPHEVHQIAAMPLNANGKIVKTELRDRMGPR